MKVRILSFFLTLCMVLSVFPAVVFAEDVTTNVTDPKDFATLLEASTDGTVKLEKSENVFVTINDDVTIDLNGYKLTGYISAPGKVVTITDSKLTGEFAAEVVGNGEKDAKLVIKQAGRIAPSLKANVATTSEITTYTDYLKVEDHDKGTESKYVVNGVSYYYFKDALAAVAAGGTIKVVASAVIDDKIDKNVTIESDSAISLKGAELANAAVVTVLGGCTLTVTDIEGNGTVEFANVSMTAYPTVATGAAVVFKAYAGYYEYIVPTEWYDTTKLVQVGNLLTAVGENVVAYVIYGKTIEAFQDMAVAVAYAQSSGGTLILNTNYDKLIEIAPGNPVTIELNGQKLLGSIINNGVLTIQENYTKDGYIPKIINKKDAILLTVKSGTVADIENYARCEFRGGTLNNLHTEGEDAAFIVYYVGENLGYVSLSVAAQLTRDNFNANAGLVYHAGRQQYVVTAYEAFIGTTGYLNAVDAFAAANAGDEVVLYVDYDGLVVEKNIKVVLKSNAVLTNVTVKAGYTLTAPFGASEYAYGEGFYAVIKAPVAKIGNVYYISLQDAVNAVVGSNKVTITLVDTDGDHYVEGAGVVVPAGKNIVFDFDGNTYDVVEGFVGSKGYETNAFQLLQGSNVTFYNGTLVSTKSVTVGDNTVWAKILIQNYTDLIDKANPEDAQTSLYIKEFTIDASQNGDELVTYYALSNNNGYVRIADSTIIADEGQIAFDVYYSASYAAGVSVLVTSENGIPTYIKGDIEVSAAANTVPTLLKLSVHAGEFEGDLLVDEALKGSDVVTIKVRGEDINGAYETSFNGISNYEEFYNYFVKETVDGVETVYGPTNISMNEDGTYKFDVVPNPAYVAEVNGVKYIDIDQAFVALAAADVAEIKLLADFAEGIVIPEGNKNITLNLGGRIVAGITNNANATVIVGNGIINGTITVNAGVVEIRVTSIGNTTAIVNDNTPLFNIAAGAEAKVRMGAATIVADVVMTGEGKLTVNNGRWYIPDEKVLYNYIPVRDTIQANADGELTYYTIKAEQYPVAQIYKMVDGNKVVLNRFSTLDEAIATAMAEKAIVEVLQVSQTAGYVVDLAPGESVTIEGLENALPTEKNADTFTEVVGNVYTGYHTSVIIVDANGVYHYYDGLSILETVDYEGEAFVYDGLAAGNRLVVNGNIYRLEIMFPGTFEGGLELEAALAVIYKGEKLTYYTGIYDTLDDYDAVAGGIRFATLEVAVTYAQQVDGTKVEVINDGAFYVNAGKTVVIDGNTYGEGKYANTKTWEAKIGTVVYATVQDALNAASTMSTDTTVTVVVKDLAVNALTINAAAGHIVLEANDAEIGTLTATGTYRVTVRNAVIGTVNDTVSANYTLFKECVIETLNSTNANLYLHKNEIGTLNLTDVAVNVNFGTAYDDATTVKTLILNGAVKLVVTSPFVVNGDIVSNEATVTGNIVTGNYYVSADDIALLVPALPANYYFQRYDGYYSPIDGASIVAEVDGYYYDVNGLADAVQYAYDNEMTLNILVDTGVTLVLTEKAPVVTVNGKATVVVDNAAYYVDAAENTYTRKLIVAVVGGTNYDNYNDAIDAYLNGKGDIINVVVPMEITVAENTLILVNVKGEWYLLDAGTYNLAKLTADAVVADAKNLISFVSFEDALAQYKNNPDVSVIYLGKDTKTVALDNGKFTGGAVAGGKLVFTGNGIVDLTGNKGGEIEIASMDLKFTTNVLLKAEVYTNIVGKAPETLCMDKAEDGFYVLSDAQLSYNGKGYHTLEEAYNAYLGSKDTEHIFKLYADAEVVDFTLGENVLIELNGYTLTVEGIIVIGDLTVFGGEDVIGHIVASENSTLDTVIGVASGARLALYDVEVSQANKYNSDYSCNSSVTLNAGATLCGNNFTIYDLLVDTDVKDHAYLDVDDVCNIADASNFSDGVAVYYRESKINSGELVCLNHKMIVVDGVYECEHCGEDALKLYVGEAGELTDVKVYVDGELQTPVDASDNVELYYLFKGDVFTVDHTEIPAGMSFVKWNCNFMLNEVSDGFEIVADSARINAVLSNNPTVPVQINAPIFQVEGIGGVQLGSAIFQIYQGAKIKVVYDSMNLLGDSTVVYWINENGTVVGFGPELTYTVPAMGASITAVAHMTNDDSTLAIFQNGNDSIGVKVMGYGSYNADTIDSLIVPKYPALGTQTVLGWNVVPGAEKALTLADIEAAILAADGVIKFYPVVAKVTNVDVTVNWADGTKETVSANPELFTVIPAKAIDGYKLAYWTVEKDGKQIAEFYTDEIIYRFDDKGYTVSTVYVEDDEYVEREPEAFLYSTTKLGKVIISGVLQLPGDAKIIDAGIVYSGKAFTEDTLRDGTAVNVVTKHATSLDRKYVVYTLTLNVSKLTETTVYAASYLTYVDADGHVVTVYSDVEAVNYNANDFGK